MSSKLLVLSQLRMQYLSDFLNFQFYLSISQKDDHLCCDLGESVVSQKHH